MYPYLGMISLFPYGFAPMDWLLCDGASLSTAEYNALYSLIQNKFGGNTTVFMIPNMLGEEPIPNMKFYIAVQGIYPAQG